MEVLYTIESLADALRLTDPNSVDLDIVRSSPSSPEPRDPFELWFRGQANFSWDLRPSFDRVLVATGIPPEVEHTLYVDFMRSEALVGGVSPRCSLDVLSLMQHYSIPTRLLDWTSNVAIGLYFAVEHSEETCETDGALYVLNPFLLNGESTGRRLIHLPDSGPVEGRGCMVSVTTLPRMIDCLSNKHPSFRRELEDGFRNGDPSRDTFRDWCRLPVAAIPHMLTQRMKAQQPMVVIHGGTHRGTKVPEALGTPVYLEEVDRGFSHGRCLVKLIIPAPAKARIRGELTRVGVHRARLFPELEHQAKHLWEQAIERHRLRKVHATRVSRIPGATEFTDF